MAQLRLISTPELPRERLLRHGPHVLTTPELLALIFGTGFQGCNAVQLSTTLLDKFGGLRNLLSAESTQLSTVKGLGKAKICQLRAIQELATRCLSEEMKYGRFLNSSDLVKRYCTNLIGHLKIEHCMAIYLDSRYRLICSEELSKGTLEQTSVYPRELVKSALKHHAAAVILAHNHPSGFLRASSADLHLTKHVKEALQLVDIKLLDHLIVGPSQALSMAEEGQL